MSGWRSFHILASADPAPISSTQTTCRARPSASWSMRSATHPCCQRRRSRPCSTQKPMAAMAPEVSEFELAGLTPLASNLVAPPRIAASPVSFECRLTQLLQLQDASGQKLPTWLVLGEVVAVHIAQRLLVNGVYDTARADHVLRGGGAADYFSVGPEQLFRMHRPRG
ncbi:MAG: flavin reductase [Burkholderiaceae bacterium]|nr:flavin reductase [Burkholderiaceae bacterium]